MEVGSHERSRAEPGRVPERLAVGERVSIGPHVLGLKDAESMSERKKSGTARAFRAG